MAEALINGNSYAFQNITMLINNLPVAHITSIDLTVTDNSANNYGLSLEPVSRGEGQEKYSGSIEMEQKEALKIGKAFSSTGLIIDIHKNPAVGLFEILLVLENGNPGDISNMRIKNCQFTTDGLSASSGDTALMKSYDILFAGIDKEV